MKSKNEKARRWHKWTGTEIAATIILTLLAALILIPFWNALVISFETSAAYARSPFSWLPGEFTLKNYEYLTQSSRALAIAYQATIGITVIGTAVGMIISVMASYVFSRSFPGKKLFFSLMLFTMFFSGGLVPTYMLFKNAGLLDTYTSVGLMGLISVYNIIIMKNGFESIPSDLQEAAMIDGANDLTIFWKIMLPLQKPQIATFSLFTAVAYWNGWYWPLMFLNSGNKTVLQLYLRSIVNTISQSMNGSPISAAGAAAEQSFSQGVKMAAVFITILPIMLVYPFLQKYFVKGVIVGAVKM